MKVSPKQIQAVLALPGAERFKHFVKTVADWEEVWGLYKNGWTLAATDDGMTVFPLWPAREYAQICAANEWDGCEPRPISLDDFMGELLPKLKLDGVLPCVFFTPTDKGVTLPIDTLLSALEAELRRY